jgi:FkbM family methyltransferase
MTSVATHMRRIVKGARMGFLWAGTSRFKPPTSFRWNKRCWALRLPNEQSLGWVFRDVILDDEYGLEQLSLQPRTILDVGANVGMFSLWAGANFPGAVIHSYEPNVGLQPYLLENIGQVEASLHAEGVSGHDGFGSFSQKGESMVGQCKESDLGDIPVVSLHTAVKRMGGSVDLLKLDCEGAEWSILEHPESFANVGCVRMEYHLIEPDHSTSRLVEAFERMGFICSHLAPNQGFGLAWFDRR